MRRHRGTASAEMRERVPPSPARRRYRYRRRHTPHFYIVSTGLSAAALVCVLDAIAFAVGSVVLANLAFVAVVIASLLVFIGYFWGFFMVMSGNIPVKRLKVLVPHAVVGTLAPLLYTINISLAIEGFDTQPVGAIAVLCSIVSFVVLCGQFVMGRAVVRPQPVHIVRKSVGDA